MTQRMGTALMATALLMIAGLASADQWNERTTLEFSAPVMIPGATLPAGKYVFELADVIGSRHTVRVLDENDRVVATIQAVPMRRPMPSDDIVVQFNPTEPGAAPAVKGWFYPGEQNGHEFIYPEEQARLIAGRTKSIVLGIDIPGTDLEKGRLRQFSASGVPADWRGDPETLRGWETWQQSRAVGEPGERRRGTAPVARSDFEGMRVTIDELEDQPTKYIGQQISVDAEIEEVYGPRLFTIDEPNWGDLDGEILVFLPTPLAAFVKDDDRVTISGTMRPFVRTEIEREWGWLGLDPAIEVEVGAKPVLVAERLVGGDNNVAMVIDTTPAAAQPVGTSGAAAADVTTLAAGDESLVGRPARITDGRVSRTGATGGFFVQAGDRQLYVLPAHPGTAVAAGDSVTVDGVVLQMPASMATRLNAPGGFNDDIYVYATTVREQ